MRKGRAEDHLQLPMSIIGFYRRKSFFHKTRNVPEKYYEWNPILRKADKPMTSFSKCGKYSQGVKIKIPKYDATNSKQLTEAEIHGRKETMRVLDYYQRKRRKRWELDHFSPIIGIREGARVVGEYCLTVEACRNGKRFEDAIAVGHYPLDAHDPGDNKRTYILAKNELRVPPYDIPFRSLIPNGINNLLVAGRNLSADQLALSSARVMTTCCAMGQSVALGIELCLKKSISPLKLAINNPSDLKKEVENFGICLDHKLYFPKQLK